MWWPKWRELRARHSNVMLPEGSAGALHSSKVAWCVCAVPYLRKDACTSDVIAEGSHQGCVYA